MCSEKSGESAGSKTAAHTTLFKIIKLLAETVERPGLRHPSLPTCRNGHEETE